MRTDLRRLLLSAGALLFAAAPSHAQPADTAAVSSALWTLCPGSDLQIALDGPRSVRGRCDRMEGGYITILGAEGSQTVALESVRTIAVRGRASVWGVVVGGALGFVVGAFVANRGANEPCASPTGERCLPSGRDSRAVPLAGGLLIGAGLGVAAGAAIPIWRTRFP